ncbi:nucleotidyl transferase AbiEii/AbiGii toxin family protein [Candidatus Micrarchaeota archaeon]|nr:nucleotidyl transferase AbiEii/AbiGii toxin family protein [Candidatus Micrarchaeota archaeon]
MNIPIANRLKKRLHVDTGILQDELVDLLYSVDNRIVMHGGTAIWRCYGGNRFSEDLDFYSPRDFNEKEFVEKARQRGLTVLKFKKTANLIFSKVTNGNVEVRVELNHSAPHAGAIRNYERMDGSLMTVLALNPQELLLEKISAYADRRLIRDIYDIFHLSSIADGSPGLQEEMRKFLHKLEPPLDEENLKAIVYSGAIPSFRQMVEQLRSRF